MTVTVVVVLVAAASAVLVFVLSAVRARPDPIDPTDRERAVIRRLASHPRLLRFLRQRLDRRTAGGLVLTASLLVVFAVALLVGVLLDMIDGTFGLATLDDDVAQRGVHHADSGTVTAPRVITYLGGTVVVVGTLTAAGLIDYVRPAALRCWFSWRR